MTGNVALLWLLYIGVFVGFFIHVNRKYGSIFWAAWNASFWGFLVVFLISLFISRNAMSPSDKANFDFLVQIAFIIPLILSVVAAVMQNPAFPSIRKS